MLEGVPLARTFGAVVASATPRLGPASLDIDEIAALYRSSGALLFRGFAVGVDGGAAFSACFTAGFVVNGETTRAYVSEAERIQTVNAGHPLIPLHAGMGGSPFRPDLIRFYGAVTQGEDRRVSFERGSPIARPVRLELFELTTRLACVHTWQAGDVLMIDKARVMPGRPPFGKDDGRRILVRMGIEAFERRG